MIQISLGRCTLKKRISDEAAETACLCNINYLLHLLFIIGVQRIYEETVFSMEISGSAERYRDLLGCARYPTVAEFFWSFSTIFPNIRACISMPMSFIKARYRNYGKNSLYLQMNIYLDHVFNHIEVHSLQILLSGSPTWTLPVLGNI